MKDLSVREIWRIGEKTEKRLQELGVKTCGDLQRFFASGIVDLSENSVANCSIFAAES